MDMKKTVTIYDIAREAGVSPATVSRILTGSAMVNLEKRERVLKLIQRYDFHPNNAARSLTEKRSAMLGILCQTFAIPTTPICLQNVSVWLMPTDICSC